MSVIPFSSTGKFSTQTSGVAVSTGAFDQTDLLRIPDVDPMFHMLNDGSSLFYRILSMFAKDAAATQPRFEFFEDNKYPTKTTIPTGVNASATTVVLGVALAFKNTVLYVPATGEALFVSANSGASCTVVRGHQGTTAAIIPDGSVVLCIGASLPEGADANGGIAILPTKNYNFCSFFSQGVNVTDVQQLTQMLNGTAQPDNEFAKQTMNLMEQMDRALRWSSRNADTSTSADGTLYYTGGFKNNISTNVLTHEGALTWYDLNDLFNPTFEPTNSSPTKTLLCGQGLYSQINKISWGHYIDGGTPQADKVLGSMIQSIQLDGGGVIDVVLDKYGFDTGTPLSNQGFLLDMNNVKIKPFTGFDLVWREVTSPGSHTKKWEVFGSTGLKMTNEETMATFAWSAGA